jgi:hypothetical protein
MVSWPYQPRCAPISCSILTHKQVLDFVRPYSGDGAEVGFLATILVRLNFAARKYGEADRPPCGVAAKRMQLNDRREDE